MVSDIEQTLIIRTDVNSQIGTGHLMRCFALAQSWKSSNGRVVFVTRCENANLLVRLKNQDFEVIEIENSYPNPADWQETKRILKNYPNSWCVVDGYHFDAEFHRAIREIGNRVLIIDDTAHLDFYDADAILNQNINADEIFYNCLPETEFLLGTKYALLREEFLEWKDWQREITETAGKILITMGGGDFYNQTLKAIRAIELLKIENLEVKAVIGGANPHLDELKNAIENSSVHIKLIFSTDNMAELMAWAGLCISAAGSTCWETAFMNLPIILIVTAENQNGIAKGLDERGFAENLGWFEQVSEISLAEIISEILLDKNRRKKMSGIGREIVDGFGAARVIEFLNKSA